MFLICSEFYSKGFILITIFSPGCSELPLLVNEPAEARCTAVSAARRAEGGVRLAAPGTALRGLPRRRRRGSSRGSGHCPARGGFPAPRPAQINCRHAEACTSKNLTFIV